MSRSPVTNASALPAAAEATIHSSSGSRNPRSRCRRGLATTSWSRRRCSISATTLGGTLIRLSKVRLSSVNTISPVIRSCSTRTWRRRSVHIPRLANALTSTFVSRNTLTTLPKRRPRPSGVPELRQTEGPYSGDARSEVETIDVEGRHGQGHCESSPSASPGDRGRVPARHRALVSMFHASCITM